ncbi:MAG: ATP-dependent DNA helicase [bacterium]
MPNQQTGRADLPAADIALSSFFAPAGPIAQSIKCFESRKQQTEMASAVEKSLSESKHLVVEAGTGVGKSLAYLLPSALWAVRNKKKVVVATYTKALQEQLIKKDLPIVRTALKKTGLPLQYSLLMGSANYLCLSRLQRCMKQGPELFEDADSKDIADRLFEWAGTAVSGLRAEVPFRIPAHVWEEVCRDSDLCMGKRCPSGEACLYRKDIARARQSDLVVVNQHLLFAGLPLPAFDAVIFDEAHNLEETASHFLGFSLTNRQVKRLLDDICNPRSGRGLAGRLKGRPALWLTRIREAVSEAHFAAGIFFQDVRSNLALDDSDEKQSGARRIRKPHFVRDPLSNPLKELAAILADAVLLSRDTAEEVEINAYMNRCLLAAEQLDAFLQCKSREHAYWVEVSRSRRSPCTSLNMAPLDVSDSLRKELFAKPSPVILTSATLAVDGSFFLLKTRLGLDQSLDVLLDSPFEYQRQAVIYTASDIPDPKENEAYERAVLEQCPKITAAVTGGVFVLYTSWQLLKKSFKVLTAASTNRPVFRQGEKSPQHLLNEFRHAGNGILLATDTFWQGIDVPGPALSCVIITRLPFLAPDTPLEEARHEWMAAKGMNVFNEYALPKAVIKFRQGFGRLIRSNTDFGAVVILDPRIRTRQYGARFLCSIPECRQVRTLGELEDFFLSKTPLKK